MGQYTVLRYKDFIFPYNPKRFTVEGAKQMFHQFAPGFGSVVSDLGRMSRVVKGEGEFFGKGAKEQFAALTKLFLDKEDGLLSLPASEPFYAYFSSLNLTGEAGADLLTYSFTFLESSRPAAEFYEQGASVTVGSSETVWHIAMETGTSVEALYAQNPGLYSEGISQGMEMKFK